jgi:gamma-glutamylcyclotransferase (GGCT)/AIG2-like uncharacterized protein YtfP
MQGIKKNNIFKSSGTEAKLFVYGTLRNAFGHQLHNMLSDQFEFIGEGSIRGILYDIGQYPGAVISMSAKTKIAGEIYQAKDKDTIDAALKILDAFEGYDGTDLTGSEFIRIKKFVKLNNGKRVLSWIYIYNGPVNDKHLIRSGDFIHHISAKDSP